GRTMILPAALAHQSRIAAAAGQVGSLHDSAVPIEQLELVRQHSTAVAQFLSALNELDRIRAESDRHGDDPAEHARFQESAVLPAMQAVRSGGDILELLVEDELWPLPKYREMLFMT
ncbi:MAG: glutamine synthetase type III, partial [Calditrichota bacterium]